MCAADNNDLPPVRVVPTEIAMMGLQQLFEGLAAVVPPPVLWGLIILFVLLGAPAWLRGVRARQVRGALRRAARAPTPEDRQQNEEAAFRLAGSRPLLLANLAETAIKQGQLPLARRALTALIAAGGAEADVRRLRAELTRPEGPPRDILATVVHIEALLAEGLLLRARDELAAALRRFPQHPELLALSARLETACPPTPSVDSSTTSSASST